MGLKHASFYRKPEPQPIQKMTLDEVAQNFVEGKVRQCIECSDRNYVNIPLPYDAYHNIDGFIAACQKVLEPLGFKAIRSHDGVGINDTLHVSW